MGLKDIIAGDSISDIQEVLKKENSIVKELKQVQQEISEARDEEAKLIGLLDSGQGGRLNKSKLDDKVKDLLIYIDDDIQGEEAHIKDNIETIEKFQGEIKNSSDKHGELDKLLEDCLGSIEEERSRLEEIANIIREELSEDEEPDNENINENILNRLDDEVSKIQPQRRALIDEIRKAEDLVKEIEREESGRQKSTA
jgi:predicted  nucleic acid-binding Zn-ribbon protein